MKMKKIRKMKEMRIELILWLVKGTRGRGGDEKKMMMWQEVGPLYIWLVYKDQQNSHPAPGPLYQPKY